MKFPSIFAVLPPSFVYVQHIIQVPPVPAAPGTQPAFTGEQMRKALAAYKERKKARQKAREEEARYVEFRKAEVLAKFHPTVGTLRSADEVCFI